MKEPKKNGSDTKVIMHFVNTKDDTKQKVITDINQINLLANLLKLLIVRPSSSAAVHFKFKLNDSFEIVVERKNQDTQEENDYAERSHDLIPSEK